MEAGAISPAVLDGMTEMALDVLLHGEPGELGALPARLAGRWPEVPALAVSYALSRAAAAIEATLAMPEARRMQAAARAGAGWRLAALTAAETLAAEELLGTRPSARDLLRVSSRLAAEPAARH